MRPDHANALAVAARAYAHDPTDAALETLERAAVAFRVTHNRDLARLHPEGLEVVVEAVGRTAKRQPEAHDRAYVVFDTPEGEHVAVLPLALLAVADPEHGTPTERALRENAELRARIEKALTLANGRWEEWGGRALQVLAALDPDEAEAELEPMTAASGYDAREQHYRKNPAI